MDEMPDPVAALISFLENDAELARLVHGRIYGEELPPAVNETMPTYCVAVSAAGGGGNIGSSWQEFGDARIDVRCYGPTTREARRVANHAYLAIKALRRVVEGGCLIHWARLSASPQKISDGATEWPCYWMSWQILAAEVAA